jgi:hypothetical protein
MCQCTFWFWKFDSVYFGFVWRFLKVRRCGELFGKDVGEIESNHFGLDTIRIWKWKISWNFVGERYFQSSSTFSRVSSHYSTTQNSRDTPIHCSFTYSFIWKISSFRFDCVVIFQDSCDWVTCKITFWQENWQKFCIINLTNISSLFLNFIYDCWHQLHFSNNKKSIENAQYHNWRFFSFSLTHTHNPIFVLIFCYKIQIFRSEFEILLLRHSDFFHSHFSISFFLKF